MTRCRFAEFFRALGEPELGALLICETDFDIALVGEGEVSLDRAQTIMRGAPSCTFRYKFAPVDVHEWVSLFDPAAVPPGPH